jgi:hypothetical protein
VPATTNAELRFEEEPAITMLAFTLKVHDQAAMTGGAAQARTRDNTRKSTHKTQAAHTFRAPQKCLHFGQYLPVCRPFGPPFAPSALDIDQLIGVSNVPKK